MLTRSSGILLPISSLPGPYGIGCFGPEALRFAESAAAAGFAYWQVLPFSPTGYADSPYQSFSAYAGNPYFINLDDLHSQGLLTADELQTARYAGSPERIDYGWLYTTREKLLRRAHARLDAAARNRVRAYAEAQADWLDEYALFRTIKTRHHERPWWEWPEAELRNHDAAALAEIRREVGEEIRFIEFVQYEFDRQWQALKAQVHRIGLRLIGDMPIYVAGDSSDAWANRQYFETGDDGLFSRVAGVPPDYFSADGQLWGNPLYNWPVLAAEGYAWWIRRIRAGLRIFDILRIDHFRGFESYWAVPAGEKTARCGVWEKGPAMDLFRYILAAVPADAIIAEDLGDINEDVRQFLARTGLPGMKVMQFAFSPNPESRDRPHDYLPNCVAYTGTHDNTTLAGWLQQAPEPELELVRTYCGFTSETPLRTAIAAVIRCLWQTCATLTVVPVQDILALGESARLNTPGTLTDNWLFRMTADQLDRLDLSSLGKMNAAFQRARRPGQ